MFAAGHWGSVDWCPTGSFAAGLRLKVLVSMVTFVKASQHVWMLDACRGSAEFLTSSGVELEKLKRKDV